MTDPVEFTVGDPVGSVDPDRFLAGAAACRYRPEWTFLVEDGARIVGRALWWGRADSERPIALDCLHVLPEVPDPSHSPPSSCPAGARRSARHLHSPSCCLAGGAATTTSWPPWRGGPTRRGRRGFTVPSATPYSRNVGYLGVVPELRGRGYVDDLLGEITWLHAADGADRITLGMVVHAPSG